MGTDAAPLLPCPDAPRGAIPRRVTEGTVPLVAVEGTAYECGRWYAEIVRERWPSYRRYMDTHYAWKDLSPVVKGLFERQAPYILDVFQGLRDGDRQPGRPPVKPPAPERPGCTSFGVSGSVTLDGHPISGQTKDVHYNSTLYYIALRIRIKDGPTILVLAYPGEVLGHGMWSTGMSIFRNSLFSTAGGTGGLTMEEMGFLTLAGTSVHDAAETARRYGVKGEGNLLVSDGQGESLSIEFNAGGVGVVPAKDGIATHANHTEGAETSPYNGYGARTPSEYEASRWRMHGLWQILNAERGRLTPQKALAALADHTYYPSGICRHWIPEEPDNETAGVVVAEPTRGLLHVVRGHACCNWSAAYSV